MYTTLSVTSFPFSTYSQLPFFQQPSLINLQMCDEMLAARRDGIFWACGESSRRASYPANPWMPLCPRSAQARNGIFRPEADAGLDPCEVRITFVIVADMSASWMAKTCNPFVTVDQLSWPTAKE
jgi:hypothetical protein